MFKRLFKPVIDSQQKEEIFEFLNKLANSDVIGMCYSAPYIQLRFELKKKSAELWLRMWLEDHKKVVSTKLDTTKKKTNSKSESALLLSRDGARQVKRMKERAELGADYIMVPGYTKRIHGQLIEVSPHKRMKYKRKYIPRVNTKYKCDFCCSKENWCYSENKYNNMMANMVEIRRFTFANHVDTRTLPNIQKQLQFPTQRSLFDNSKFYRSNIGNKIVYFLVSRNRMFFFKQGNHE